MQCDRFQNAREFNFFLILIRKFNSNVYVNIDSNRILLFWCANKMSAKKNILNYFEKVEKQTKIV